MILTFFSCFLIIFIFFLRIFGSKCFSNALKKEFGKLCKINFISNSKKKGYNLFEK